MPNATNGTGLIVSTTTTFPLGNVGSYLNCPVDDRIYIHINELYDGDLLLRLQLGDPVPRDADHALTPMFI